MGHRFMMSPNRAEGQQFVINNGIQEGFLNPQQFTAIDPMAAVVSHQADWLQFQMAAVQHQQQQQQQMTMLDSSFSVPESVYENRVVDVGYNESQLAITMAMPAMLATSSESRPTAPRKHRFSDVMEKTIERRQKRMIKNRESAARSRARKQAYTNQLELEVKQLKKTNSWLKRQKEVEMLLSSNTNDTVPKYQLRRTSSASF